MAKDELKTEKASKKEKEKSPAKDTEKKSKSKEKDSGKNKSQKKQPNKVAKYFKDLKSEFKKVVWPTKEQTLNNTAVVMATLVIFGVFVTLCDLGLSALLNLILNLVSK